MAFLRSFHLVAFLFLLAFLSFGGQGLPLSCNTTTITRSACAQVGHLALQTKSTTIPAELAHECLKSVPLHVDEARHLHRSLVPYLKWQTTFSYLKDPPAGYPMPAYDFWRAFDNVGVKLSKASYPNEWEFGMDLFWTFNKAHDAHLRYILDIVGKAFSFRRSMSLVSVSRDGRAPPQIYVQDDIKKWFYCNTSFPAAVVAINEEEVELYLDRWMRLGWHQDPDALYNALFWSAVQNTGEAVAEGYTDGLFGGAGIGQLFYPGPNTSMRFANGTTIKYPNFAEVEVSFTGVDGGESFYEKFCTGEQQLSISDEDETEIDPSPSSSKTTDFPTVRTATPGYPVPVVRHPENLIVGYYHNSFHNDNIAVLSIANFVTSNGGPSQAAFQRTTREFLRLAKAANRTKLILDLRGNPGGTILQAFGLFKQLFPHLSPWGGSRFRAFDTLDAIGQQISFLSDAYYDDLGTNDTTNSTASATYQQAATYEPFNLHQDTTAHCHSFPNWGSLYGPVRIPSRDTFTHLIRYNLSSPLLFAGLGFNISTATAGCQWSALSSHDDGTRDDDLVNNNDHPFFVPATDSSSTKLNDNILMLHDGLCTSTCATFADMLRAQAGVKSIVMGGRPPSPLPPQLTPHQQRNHSANVINGVRPAQAVGGTRGMEVYSFDHIYELMRFVWRSGTEADRAIWNETTTTLTTTAAITAATAAAAAVKRAAPDLGRVSTEPMRRWGRAGWGTVNVRDSVLVGDADGYLGNGGDGYSDGDGLPSQFLWVPADCRLWYTPEMVVVGGVREIWEKVAEVAWGGSEGPKGDGKTRCVVGGL